MAGILDVSSPNLNGTALFTPMHNLENKLHAYTQSSYSFLWSTKTEAAGAAAANQKQQQQWSMGARSSASKLSQILDPSPLWKLPSPKEHTHKYKQVTIRHTMGTTQNMGYRSVQSMLRHPCGVHDFTQAEST